MKNLKNSLMTKHIAFTLAEMLITIVIIGVIAVITIPDLISEIHTKNWDSASKNFETKFEQALKIMNTQGTLAYHSSTEDFVNELGKNFKIANICKNKPSDCFEDTMFWGEQALDMTKVVDNKDFGMRNWPDTEAIGVQFANGITAILAYNKGCRQNQFSNETNVFDCISMVYDTTAKADPNENSKDIRTINVNRLLNAGCAVVFKDDGLCVTKTAFRPKALDCTDSDNDKYCKGTIGNSNYTKDYWAGARKACDEDDSQLPNDSELAKIASNIYGVTIGKSDNIKSGLTFNSTNASKYGINQFGIWTSSEFTSSAANARFFKSDSSTYGNQNKQYGNGYGSDIRTICIGKS